MSRTGTVLLLVVAASLAVLAAEPARPVDPVMDSVLKRAGLYVLEFERQLSGVVAEEAYLQTSSSGSGAPVMPGGRRELKSDLLMVKPVGTNRYMAFRDVFEVDHRAVRDREDRLMKLFLAPSA